jgi:hypothetical protein
VLEYKGRSEGKYTFLQLWKQNVTDYVHEWTAQE